LVLSFGSSPINSFTLDWEVFRKGTGITIKADGVVIFQDLLTKSEKKTGVSDHLAPVFFDYPIHTLELIGLKKSKIGIDNLAVNIPQPKNDSGSKESADSGRPPKTPEDAGLHTESGEEGDYKDGYLGRWGDSYDEGSHHFGGQVPEPATFILFGVGLLAIGIFCRKHDGTRLSKPVYAQAEVSSKRDVAEGFRHHLKESLKGSSDYQLRERGEFGPSS
jgi:hypothetical protein